ncbi:Pentatricopeptide repeat-containing protein [Camellia lanceoleosa]|uniref:Pentatricopeptide repeat-containing protein n=1 Tax=Camellia lanceoleosa TaxID=1840588 RepID=A0ACC0HMM4_9ERIC|nr:Pentatricopeptide repeat-containing protein [Camellia lanceoleosa]
MPSSFPSLCPPSTLPHFPIPFPSPKSPIFFSSHYTTQQTKLVLFATLPTSTSNSSRNSSSNTLSLAKRKDILCSKQVSDSIHKKNVLPTKEKSNLDFDRKNSRLQVQDLVKRIRALPNSQRTRIVDIMETDGGFQTISDFNDLLMALVTEDELELALKLYYNLSYYGLVPDCWTFSIMIRCYCKKNEPSEAKRLVDHMFENGSQPTVATFTVLISTVCRSGRVQKALEVMEIMHRINCKPTIQTYNCLLKGLCYVGQVEKAYELLMNIKKTSTKPDVYTYTVVMDGFCKVGRSDEAYELLDEALEMGLIPNVVTFNTLFTGYFKEGRPLEGIGLLNLMKDTNCIPDYISYSTLLHGLLKWGEIHTALRIYEEMVGIGFQVDERMMNTLLRGLCRRSRKEKEMLEHAHQVFERMKNGAAVIYSCTYDLMIEVFCTGKDMYKAMVNLREMVEVGYAPKNITFNNVIRALCVEGKVEEALSVLVLMHRGSSVPTKISFNILISEFNRQGRWLGACNVYGSALKVGVIPEKEPRGYSTERKALI